MLVFIKLLYLPKFILYSNFYFLRPFACFNPFRVSGRKTSSRSRSYGNAGDQVFIERRSPTGSYARGQVSRPTRVSITSFNTFTLWDSGPRTRNRCECRCRCHGTNVGSTKFSSGEVVAFHTRTRRVCGRASRRRLRHVRRGEVRLSFIF